MGTSTSSSGKCPTYKDNSKASNDGFAKRSASNVHSGSTIMNYGGKGYRGDVRGGGKRSGKSGNMMKNTY